MSGDAGRALTGRERIAYAIGNFGVGSVPAVVGSWALYYYAPPASQPDGGDCLVQLVPVSVAIAAALAFGRVVEALLNPFIGHWSDRCRAASGRRIPFIRWGTPLMCLAAVIVWFPPLADPSWLNAAWVALFMSVMSGAYAAVVAPYLSLLPELTPHDGERITVSAYMAVAEVLGVLAVTLGASAIIDAFKCGFPVAGTGSIDGFQLAGILFAAAGLAVFWITGFGVRERPWSAAKEVSYRFGQGMREVFRNHSFVPYLFMVAFMRIALDIVIVAVPYVTTVILGGSELDAGLIMAVVIVGSMAFFPAVGWLSSRFGKKAVMLSGAGGFVVMLPLVATLPGWTFIGDPLTQGYALFLLAAYPVAVFSVLQRPLMADIIDHDEKLTGFRREAIYNGMEGLFSRSASGFSWLLSALLFDLFGKSPERPLGILLTGPVGGAIALVAVIGFLRYPFRK